MSVGYGQLLIVLFLVLIIFGVGKLPQVLEQMGKGVRAFKDGMDGKEEDRARRQIDVTPDEDDDVEPVEEVKQKKGTRASG